MIGRERWLSVILAACMTAAAGPNTREEFRIAMTQARDGDLQADWNKMLDARERFTKFSADEELAPLAHYYLAYTDWRLSSLAFITAGPMLQARLVKRAIASLETAIQKRPHFAEAHALLATCLILRLYTEPAARDEIVARSNKEWDAALADGANNPRVMLLRAMRLTFAPPPYGNRPDGIELWHKAIKAFEAEHPEPLQPDWGHVEAIAWLGGAHMMADQNKDAVEQLERAARMRPDFWWSKAALPVARRPAPMSGP